MNRLLLMTPLILLIAVFQSCWEEYRVPNYLDVYFVDEEGNKLIDSVYSIKVLAEDDQPDDVYLGHALDRLVFIVKDLDYTIDDAEFFLDFYDSNENFRNRDTISFVCDKNEEGIQDFVFVGYNSKQVYVSGQTSREIEILITEEL